MPLFHIAHIDEPDPDHPAPGSRFTEAGRARTRRLRIADATPADDGGTESVVMAVPVRRTRTWLWISTLAAGLVAGGWIVGRLPALWSVPASFRRSMVSGVARQSVVIDPIVLRNELVSTEAAQAVLVACPEAQREFRLDDNGESLRRQTVVTVEPDGVSADIVTIEVHSTRPHVAARLAKLLVERHAEETARRLREWERRSGGQTVSADDTRATLVAERQRLSGLEREFASLDPSIDAERLEGVQLALNRLSGQRDRLRLAVQADMIAGTSPVPLVPEPEPIAQTDPSRQTLVRQALERAMEERRQLAETFTEQHPTVAAMDRKIRELATEAGIRVDDLTASGSRHTVRKPDAQAPSSELTDRLRKLDGEIETNRREERDLLGRDARRKSLEVEIRDLRRRISGLENDLNRPTVVPGVATESAEKVPPQVDPLSTPRTITQVGPDRIRLFLLGAGGWTALIGLSAVLAGFRSGRSEPLADA